MKNPGKKIRNLSKVIKIIGLVCIIAFAAANVFAIIYSSFKDPWELIGDKAMEISEKITLTGWTIFGYEKMEKFDTLESFICPAYMLVVGTIVVLLASYIIDSIGKTVMIYVDGAAEKRLLKRIKDEDLNPNTAKKIEKKEKLKEKYEASEKKEPPKQHIVVEIEQHDKPNDAGSKESGKEDKKSSSTQPDIAGTVSAPEEPVPEESAKLAEEQLGKLAALKKAYAEGNTEEK